MTCPGGGRETGLLRPGTVPRELSHRDGDPRIGFDKPRCRVAEQQRRNLEQHGWRRRFPAHPVSPSTPVSPARAEPAMSSAHRRRLPVRSCSYVRSVPSKASGRRPSWTVCSARLQASFRSQTTPRCSWIGSMCGSRQPVSTPVSRRATRIPQRALLRGRELSAYGSREQRARITSAMHFARSNCPTSSSICGAAPSVV